MNVVFKHLTFPVFKQFAVRGWTTLFSNICVAKPRICIVILGQDKDKYVKSKYLLMNIW